MRGPGDAPRKTGGGVLRDRQSGGVGRTLEACGCQVADLREFPDHHRYTAADFDGLAAWADSLDVAAILCTGKDLVKLPALGLCRHPCWALEIGWEFAPGKNSWNRVWPGCFQKASQVADPPRNSL